MAPESDQQDIGDDVRKKALVRLMVAGLVTAAALGGLWWMDQDTPQKPEKSPQPAHPAPILPAKTAEMPLPLAATPETEIPAELPAHAPTPPEVISERPPETAIATPPVLATPRSSVPHGEQPAFTQRSAPPPPHVNNAPRIPPSPAGTLAQKTLQTPPLPALPGQPGEQSAKPSPSSGIGNFLVQLGVFGNPMHAQELVQRLRKQGIQARTETRVHIGPFSNEREAEKARAEMRRLGLDAVITPVAAKK